MLPKVCEWTVIAFTKNHWILSIHSNFIQILQTKNVSWLHFSWATQYIVGGRTFKCSTTHAKRSFHRSINAIFGKNWQSSIRGGDPWAGKKTNVGAYAMFVVWTRMLNFAKKLFEMVRLCYRTIPNEII